MKFDIAKKEDAVLLREEQFFKSAQKTLFCCERKGVFFLLRHIKRPLCLVRNKEDAILTFTAECAEHKISTRIKAGR